MPARRASTSSSVSFSPACVCARMHEHLTYCHARTKTGQNVAQLSGVDEAISLFVKHLQAFNEILHTPLFLLPTHRVIDWEKLLKCDSLRAW